MAKIQQPPLPLHAHYLIPNHIMNIQPPETTVPALAQDKLQDMDTENEMPIPKRTQPITHPAAREVPLFYQSII